MSLFSPGLLQNKPAPLWTFKGVFRWEQPINSAQDANRQNVTGDPTGYVWQYIWSTPIFDLRPDLLSQVGNQQQGVSIWDRAARLRVLLSGINGASMNGNNLTVYGENSVGMYEAEYTRNISSGTNAAPEMINIGRFDATNLFYPSGILPSTAGIQRGILASFSAPGMDLGGGEGYPIRYWRLSLTFEQLVESPLPLPPPVPPTLINITAAEY